MLSCTSFLSSEEEVTWKQTHLGAGSTSNDMDVSQLLATVLSLSSFEHARVDSKRKDNPYNHPMTVQCWAETALQTESKP